MESTSSVTSLPVYPCVLDRFAGEAAQGPTTQPDTNIFTQPVARKPIDPQCGGADHAGGANPAFEPQLDDHAPRLDYESDLSSRRPL
jgi:hypothetical protein